MLVTTYCDILVLLCNKKPYENKYGE